ncbi:MAG TPA: DUF1702 family protein [Ferruginibacter sp.]|nr:DUF1702 family protein [Chitinophagaceae bacterium]HQW93203.1 DUF1702 family protein [Ferruginibacter sp.]
MPKLNTMNDVIQKIESIQSVFLETQLFYATHNDINGLVSYMEHIPVDFRSIAFESASMAIAIKDLERGGELTDWVKYVSGPAQEHQAQVYVGLGWAIAKLKLPFLPVVEKIENDYHFRVADGCGYYDGSFRQRQTVLSLQLPAYLPQAALCMYDQGVGRSLWYSCRADIHKVKNKIEGFPAERQAALWRGMGIAVAYVGGCDDAYLETVWQYAGANGIQLAYGAALAARSRMKANTMTTDTDRCSRLWFMCSAGGANEFSAETGDTTGTGNEAGYINWITQIEDRLADSFRG